MNILRGAKRSFLRGLAALVPALLTVVVLVLGVKFVYDYFGQYVNTAIIYIIHWVSGWEVEEIRTFYEQHFLHWSGVILAIVGLAVAAYLLGTYLGGRIFRIFESWVVHFPVLRKIYPGAKQVSEFIFSERQVEFRRVVAIEYPRRGIWSIGFVTGRSFRALSQHTEQELLTVFVPSSPTPITGYVVAVPRREVVDLPITVDEAFQYAISGGVIMPPAERVESLEVALLVKEGAARADDGEVEAEAGAEAPVESAAEAGEEPPAAPKP